MDLQAELKKTRQIVSRFIYDEDDDIREHGKSEHLEQFENGRRLPELGELLTETKDPQVKQIVIQNGTTESVSIGLYQAEEMSVCFSKGPGGEGKVMDWHKHPEGTEWLICAKGRVRVEFRDHDVCIGVGEGTSIPKETEHRVHYLQDHLLLAAIVPGSDAFPDAPEPKG